MTGVICRLCEQVDRRQTEGYIRNTKLHVSTCLHVRQTHEKYTWLSLYETSSNFRHENWELTWVDARWPAGEKTLASWPPKPLARHLLLCCVQTVCVFFFQQSNLGLHNWTGGRFKAGKHSTSSFSKLQIQILLTEPRWSEKLRDCRFIFRNSGPSSSQAASCFLYHLGTLEAVRTGILLQICTAFGPDCIRFWSHPTWV